MERSIATGGFWLRKSWLSAHSVDSCLAGVVIQTDDFFLSITMVCAEEIKV